jgi:hypothetical protein
MNDKNSTSIILWFIIFPYFIASLAFDIPYNKVISAIIVCLVFADYAYKKYSEHNARVAIFDTVFNGGILLTMIFIAFWISNNFTTTLKEKVVIGTVLGVSIVVVAIISNIYSDIIKYKLNIINNEKS